MLDILNETNNQIKKIKDSNDYIHFVDDILHATEEISIFDLSGVLGDNFMFPNISVNKFYKTSINDKKLEQYLIDSYIDNDSKPITITKDKKSLLNHFKPYIIKNFNNLNEYSEVIAHTNEYNILSYCLYKGMDKLYPNYFNSENLFVVNSILESELVYKVSIKLKKEINIKKIRASDYIFEDIFRNNSLGQYDDKVRVFADNYKDNLIFTISKFKSNFPISIGDILNFGMGYTYTDLISNKYNNPLIIGLLDNDEPLILDYDTSLNIAIVGSQDYCPIAYSIVSNLVMINHYEDLQFIICSQKDNTFWKMFSRNPHVLGYHTKPDQFKEIIGDVYAIHKERMQAINKSTKSFEQTKNKLIKKNKYHSKLIFVIDGISKILSGYRNIYPSASEEVYNLIYSMLDEIAKYSEYTGISIMGISERGNKSNFPQNIINNSIFKMAMYYSSENDINTLFGVDIIDLSSPIGYDYNIIEYTDNNPRYCKTCSLGGLNQQQMLAITRVIAFDWVRKSTFSDLSIVDKPQGLNLLYAYNRDSIASDSLSKILDGKVIPSW